MYQIMALECAGMTPGQFCQIQLRAKFLAVFPDLADFGMATVNKD